MHTHTSGVTIEWIDRSPHTPHDPHAISIYRYENLSNGIYRVHFMSHTYSHFTRMHTSHGRASKHTTRENIFLAINKANGKKKAKSRVDGIFLFLCDRAHQGAVYHHHLKWFGRIATVSQYMRVYVCMCVCVQVTNWNRAQLHSNP